MIIKQYNSVSDLHELLPFLATYGPGFAQISSFSTAPFLHPLRCAGTDSPHP